MAESWGGGYSQSRPELRHVPGTISSPIVQMLFDLGKTSVTIKTLTFAQLKQPEHLSVNPHDSSPAFSDREALKTWESAAILTHLLETYDDTHQLHPPPLSALRPKFLFLQAYILATVYPFVASLFLHTLKPTAEQDAAFVAAGRDKWRTLMAPVLVASLGDATYLLGERISAVDYLLAKPLKNADALGELDAFPSLCTHFRGISALDSFRQAYAVK